MPPVPHRDRRPPVSSSSGAGEGSAPPPASPKRSWARRARPFGARARLGVWRAAEADRLLVSGHAGSGRGSLLADLRISSRCFKHRLGAARRP